MAKSTKKAGRTRGNGTGSVVKRGNFFWAVVQNPVTGKRDRLSTHKTKTEASAALDAYNVARRSGTNTQPTTVTVREYCIKWLHELEILEKRAPNTINAHRDALDYAVAQIGHMRMQDVRFSHLKTMMTAITELRTKQGEPLATRTLNYIAARVKSVFKSAVHEQILTVSPATALKSPKIETTTGGMSLDEPNLRLLLNFGDAIQKTGRARLWVMVRLALATGLRNSELFGLRWQDVQLEHEMLYVKHTAVSQGGKVVRSETTKTAKSARGVPLAPSVVAMLREHKNHQNAEREQAGEFWENSGAVFATKTGGWIHPDALRHDLNSWAAWWRSTPEEREKKFKGMPVDDRTALSLALEGTEHLPRLSPHDLRHTAGTTWLRNGVNLDVVASYLGHEDTSTTFRIYRHFFESEKKAKMFDVLAHYS